MFLAEDNITSKDEPWAALNDSLDTSTELVDQTQMGNPYERETFVVNINDTGSIAVLDTSQSLKNIEHVLCTMVKATNDFKRLFNDVKLNYERRIEVLQKERDAAVSAMRVQVHTDIDDPNISGSLHGNEIISAKKVSNIMNYILNRLKLNIVVFYLPVRQLQSGGAGRVLAVSKDALLLGVLPAQGLECSSGGVRKESTGDNATGHVIDR